MSATSILHVRKSLDIGALIGAQPPVPELILCDPAGKRRAKIWDLSPNLHCSLIGTCLTSGELRQVFVKIGDSDARSASDHNLHGRAVRAASQSGRAATLLHKALDKRHESLLKRYAKAASGMQVRELWRQSWRDGDISGAYWAVLTHPAADRTLVQEVFGQVHMLSHSIGASNRTDIARLRDTEKQLFERDEKIARQENRLRAAAEERANLIRKVVQLESDRALLQMIRPISPDAVAMEAEFLQRKLEDEKSRSAALLARLQAAEAGLRSAREAIAEVEECAADLKKELAAFENELASVHDSGGERPTPGLQGISLLYVGGRPGQIEKIRAIAQRRGGELISHDGGIEESIALLPGLVSRAAIAFFPVDCISHSAAGQVKKLCRESGKPYVPLRTASLASFLAAIENTPIAARHSVAAE